MKKKHIILIQLVVILSLTGFISFKYQEVNDLSNEIISAKKQAAINLKEADRQRKIADEKTVVALVAYRIAEEEKERADKLSADLKKCKRGR